MTRKQLLLLGAAVTAVAFTPLNSELVYGYGSSSPLAAPDSTSTPVCGDKAPTSSPRLMSAVGVGGNRVRLTWAEASDPVSYYLVTFGNNPGEQTFGNPNVGGKGTTSYTVESLSGGKRYYFRVRAGNGCTPGPYSNEVSGVARGVRLTGNVVPEGFQPGVLGAETVNTGAATPTLAARISTPTVTVIAPETVAPQNEGFLRRLIRFFFRLLGGR